MNIEDLALDIASVEDGVWFPFGDDGAVLIAQWMNKDHSAFMRDMAKRYGRKISQGAINEEQARKLIVPQWPTIIKGLKGFFEEGKEVSYSKELILRWAATEKYSAFFKSCEELAKEEQNYREANLQDLGEQSAIK